MNYKNPHIEMIEIIASGLKELLHEVVFVGGTAVSLYLDAKTLKAQVSGIRTTEDVDCIIQIATYQQYNQLESRLRSLGFKNHLSSNTVVCRWNYKGIIVDIMPTGESILGFSNKWYLPGIKAAIYYYLPSGLKIKILTFPYFLAVKVAAFVNRGRQDIYMSKDLEDIVFLLDSCPKIREELNNAPAEILNYLRHEISPLIEEEEFQQSILGHLTPGRIQEERARRILDILMGL